MFKTILATTAATLLATAAAAPANAALCRYCSSNGVSLNGLTLNGGKLNGTAPAASSFALDGIELPASVR